MIYVYTQPDCPPCKRVILLLQQAGIDPVVVDLSKNQFAADYWKRIAKSTPIVEDMNTGHYFVGDCPDKLKVMIERVLNDE